MKKKSLLTAVFVLLSLLAFDAKAQTREIIFEITGDNPTELTFRIGTVEDNKEVIIWEGPSEANKKTHTPNKLGKRITVNASHNKYWIYGDVNFIEIIGKGGDYSAKLDVRKNPLLYWIKAVGQKLNSVLFGDDHAALKTLFLDKNKISSIELSKMPNIEELGIHDNKLTALDISKNSKLKTLNAHYNQISSIDVSNNENLEILNAYWNPLSSINVTKNTKLTRLQVDGLKSTSIDLSKNTKLTRLSLTETKLTGLDLSKNTKLEEVFIDKSQFDACALDALYRTLHSNPTNTTKRISISGNPGWRSSKLQIATKKGWKVNEKWNEPETDAVNTKAWECAPYITLNLSKEKPIELKSIKLKGGAGDIQIEKDGVLSTHPIAAGGSNLSLEQAKNYKIVGEIEEIEFRTPEAEDYTTTLDFSKNTLLKKIYATNINLNSVTIGNQPNLTALFLEKNQISTLDLLNAPNLEELRLGENNISQIDLQAQKKLSILRLSRNNLSSIDLSKNTELAGLSITHNELTTIDISNQKKLQYLTINNNKLSACELDALFLQLHNDATIVDRFIGIEKNPDASGNSSSRARWYIAKNKGWKVVNKWDDRTEYTKYPKNICETVNKLSENEVVYTKSTAEAVLSGKVRGTGGIVEIYGDGKLVAAKILNKDKWLHFEELKEANTYEIVGDIDRLDILTKSPEGVTHQTSLDISKNPLLEIVNANYNKLSEFKHSDANGANLSYLGVWENTLESIDISNLPNLTTFSPGESSTIKSLDVTNNKKLYKIELDEMPAMTACAFDEMYATLHSENLGKQKFFSIGGSPATYKTKQQLAKDKGWDVRVTWNDVTPVVNQPFAGYVECDTPLPQITLTVQPGEKINFQELKAAAGEKIYFVGERGNSKEININDLSNGTYSFSSSSDKIVVYGKLTSFAANGNKERLKGIDLTKAYEEIEVLYLDNAYIDAIDVSNLKKLKRLMARGLKIKSIDISENHELELLNANYNNLTEFKHSAANGEKLEILGLWENSFESVDVSDLPNLKYISLGVSPTIKKLDFTNNTKLYKIELDNMPAMTACAFDAMYETLHNNAVSDLEGKENTQKFMSIEGSPATHSTNHKLATDKGWQVRAKWNATVTVVNQPFHDYIECEDPLPRITLTVKPGEPINFQSLKAAPGTKIQFMGEEGNIEERTIEELTDGKHTFTSQSDKIVVYGELTSFGASGNKEKLTGIDLTKAYKETEVLGINNADIDFIDVSNLKKLKRLTARMLKIKSIDISTNHELEYLNANYNNLAEFKHSAANGAKLDSIGLWQNSFESVDLSDLPNLKYVSLGASPIIKELNFTNNTKLYKIELDDMPAMTACAFDAMYGTLHNENVGQQKFISIGGSPATYTTDQQIAKNKQWDVRVKWDDKTPVVNQPFATYIECNDPLPRITLTVKPGETIYFNILTAGTGKKIYFVGDRGETEEVLIDDITNDSYNFKSSSNKIVVYGELNGFGVTQNKENLTAIDLTKAYSETDSIYVNNANIESIDVSNLKKLKRLTARRLKIKSIDISENHELEFLNANYNNLTEFKHSAANGEKLESLALWKNSFESVDLSDLPNLKYVSLGASPTIKELDFTNNTKLFKIELDNMPAMTACAFDAMYATLHNDEVSDFDGNANIQKHVSIGGSPATYTTDQKIAKNKQWDVRVKWNDETPVVNQPYSEYIECTDDRLPRITLTVKPGQEIKMKKLKAAPGEKIYFVGGRGQTEEVLIDNISNGEYKFTSTSDKIVVYGRLTSFVTRGNGDELSGIKLTEAYDKLDYFGSDQNSISEIDISKNLNLETVIIRHSNIESLDISENKELKTLVSNHNVKMKEFKHSAANPNIVRLEVWNNELSSFDATKFPNLELLSVGKNPIKSLNLSQNSKLKELQAEDMLLDACALDDMYETLNENGEADKKVSIKGNPGWQGSRQPTAEEKGWKVQQNWNNPAEVNNVKTDKAPDGFHCDNGQVVSVKTLYNKLSGTQVYPNPLESELIIESKDELILISLYDMTGREIIRRKAEGFNQKHLLDCSHLVHGIYILRLTAKNGATATHKLIKK